MQSVTDAPYEQVREKHINAAPAREVQVAWGRWPDEPAHWYIRFTVYRLLGPTRTLLTAYRMVALFVNFVARYPHPGWAQMADKWEWAARATAWDAMQMDVTQVQRQGAPVARGKGRRSQASMAAADVASVAVAVSVPKRGMSMPSGW